ncbi:uncharacterized protein PADG_00156 [Paracoccidioides brasiliensis Pb18]|uniref:Uncharacterized protein n=1 Tax=Paracoccidioides brasiliensis (strain Pb18) TaxID=502780 RepID=C1FZW6_PARBD|nr:uncharacterized protein PADG_00156 [Paracoccidioides brasiliensis Pb18]EEH43867.2 hypothetical protein PADG_00156 [Paracoccidioides brasiliensis Pb18]
MSSLLWTIDPDGENIVANSNFRAANANAEKLRKNTSLHGIDIASMQQFIDQLVPTYTKPRTPKGFPPSIVRVGFFPRLACLESFGLPHDMEAEKPISRQAGAICYGRGEYDESEQGRANAHVGLYQVHNYLNARTASMLVARDLPDIGTETSGRSQIVVVTRAIAAPTITRGLAELRTSVM